MRVAVLCAIGLGLITPSQNAPEFDLRIAVVEFEKYHDPFVRKLFGCPLTGELTPEVCKLALGTLDYNLWRKSRAAAAKLYQFKECPPR